MICCVSHDGTLVSDRRQKLLRWKDHYSNLLNRQHIDPPANLAEEAANARPARWVHQLWSTNLGWSSCGHRQAQEWQGTRHLQHPFGVVEGSWPFWCRVANLDSGPHPRRLARGVILPFYKGKGSRQDCSNYRGITLLSVPGKVFAHVLLSRVCDRLRSHGKSPAKWLYSTQIMLLIASSHFSYFSKLDANIADSYGLHMSIWRRLLTVLIEKPCEGCCSYPWVYHRSWLIFLKPSIPTHSAVFAQMDVTQTGFLFLGWALPLILITLNYS